MLTQLLTKTEILEINEIISLTEYQKIESKGKLLVKLTNNQQKELDCNEITCIKIQKNNIWHTLWSSNFGYSFNYETFYHVANLGNDKKLVHSAETQKYLCSYFDAIGSDELWSRQDRNLFLDKTIKKLVPQLDVVESGCRYGVWTYSAYVHGANKAVGFDFDTNCLMVCDYACKHLNVPTEQCYFVNADATNFDYSEFDLVLCLGVMYNVSDENKNKILSKMVTASKCLVEFWCINSSDETPRTYEYIASNGWTQYMPNKAQAEFFLSKNGYVFEDITPKSFLDEKLENRYYLCQPKKISGFLL